MYETESLLESFVDTIDSANMAPKTFLGNLDSIDVHRKFSTLNSTDIDPKFFKHSGLYWYGSTAL